jgi:hypothetical protein
MEVKASILAIKEDKASTLAIREDKVLILEIMEDRDSDLEVEFHSIKTEFSFPQKMRMKYHQDLG